MSDKPQAETPQTQQPDSAPAGDAPQLAATLSALQERLEKAEQALAAATAKTAQKPPTPSPGPQKEADEYKAKLAALEADAAIGRTWRERESERISKAAETMPQEWRSVVDAATDIQAKANLVALYEAQTKTQTQTTADSQTSSPPSSPARKPLPTGAPVSATYSINLADMLNSREITLSEAKHKYPKEYEAIVASTMNAKPQKRGLFGR